MGRYFLELSYMGTRYSGFQVQINTPLTIQHTIENAIEVLLKKQVALTGSSRTDAGVHALQNFFHFDEEQAIDLKSFVYKLNAILPPDIVIQKCISVCANAHCRFDAVSRKYQYFIYSYKNPFLVERAFYYPYTLDVNLLNQAAEIILHSKNFTTFSKRNTQVSNFICTIKNSSWQVKENGLVYTVEANRFLRGMVKALTATMLQVGRGKMSLNEFAAIINEEDCTKASFAVPAHGLFLCEVNFPYNYFSATV